MKTSARRTSSKGRYRHGMLAGLCLFAIGSSLMACQVPVFRYALERWSPDQYRILVLSNGPLDEEQRIALTAPDGTSERLAPAPIEVHDVTTTQDPVAKQLWKGLGSASGPLMVVLYPEKYLTAAEQVAFSSPLSTNSVAQVVDSPVRQEIIKRMSAGHSAVWIFLESGDPSRDKAALQTLQQQLQKDAEWLKLPTPEEMEIEPEVFNSTKIRLKIEFSVISVKRDDPQEQFLIDCLRNSESDLRGFDEPMAFPVFGRGRVLYALVGQGISADTVRKASAFIVGPCSCQVKEQNPGFDLLLGCDWNDLVGDIFMSEPIPQVDSTPQLLTIPPGRSKSNSTGGN